MARSRIPITLSLTALILVFAASPLSTKAEDVDNPGGTVTRATEEGEALAPSNLPEWLQELTKDHLEERLGWLTLQRAYPYSEISSARYEAAARAYIAAREATLQRHLMSLTESLLAPEGALPTTAWAEVGPAPIHPSGINFGDVTGRISAVAVHPTEPSTILIGGSRGGIWRTLDGGTTWTPVGDAQATLVIGDIEFAPSDPNVVYAVTGDDDMAPQISGALTLTTGVWGAGVLKSINKGQTWARVDNGTAANGIPTGTILSRVAVDPTNANKVVAAGWIEQSKTGSLGRTAIFYSQNGGTTWTTATIPTALSLSNFRSLVIEPNCPTNLWAINYADHAINRSVNAGATWTAVATAGLPAFTDNSQIAVQSAACGGPRTVYVSAFSSDGLAGGLVCVGGSNAGGLCTASAQCTGNCVGGTSPGQICALNVECPGVGAVCAGQGTCSQTCAYGGEAGTPCTNSCGGGGGCGDFVCRGGGNNNMPCFFGPTDCPGGTCGLVCFNGTNPNTPCTNDAQCTGGGTCTGRRCVGGTTAGASCQTSCNLICGNICMGGTRAGRSCAANADCPGGGACAPPNPGVYRSVNDGANWTFAGGPSGGCLRQCDYDHGILVDPTDAARVYMVGRDIWSSSDSGAHWTNRSGGFTDSDGYLFGKMHVDLHDLAIRGAGGTAVIYVAGDGGLWSYDVAANTFTNRNGNLAISELIDLAVRPDVPGQALAGLQDNGSIAYGAASWFARQGGDGGATGYGRSTAGSPPPFDAAFTTYIKNTGYRTKTAPTGFSACIGGQTPGADCASSTQDCSSLACGNGTNDGTPCTSNFDCTGGGTCQAGFCSPYKCFGGPTPGVVCAAHATCGVGGQCRIWASDPDFGNEGAEFYGPWIYTPGDNRVWHGANSIWYCPIDTDCHPWTKLAGTDNLAASIGASYISKLAINNPSTGVVGPLYASAFTPPKLLANDAGAWVDRTTGLPNRYITRIVFDPNAPQKVWVTVSGFGTGHVWFSGNGGRNWIDRSGDLPNVPVNVILLDPEDRQNVWYVGTDIGVWGTVNAGVNWAVAGTNLPAAMVSDLELDQNRTLYAATGGRSVWKIALPSPGVLAENEPNGSFSTAVPLGSTKRIASGNIVPNGDLDFYSYGASPGDRIYSAVGDFSNGSSPFTSDSVLDLLASDGATVLETDDDDGSFGVLSSSIAGTTIANAGTSYLRVKEKTGTNQVRPYRLYFRAHSGTPTAETEPNDTIPQANDLAAAGWMKGTHNPANDFDYFKMTLNAGDTVFLSLDTDPERDGVTWNGRLGLGTFDVSATVLVVDDANVASPNSEAAFYTVLAGGTYYASVDTTAQNSGGATQTYNLSVTVFPAVDEGTGCTTYTSADTPKNIPDSPGQVTSTINVPDVRIADVDVSINLVHTFMQDLDVNLVTPAGNDNGLFTDIGGTPLRMNVRLDDEAALPITAYSILNGMASTPERDYRLSWFDGERAQGNWTLVVRDDTAGDSGVLNQWSIRICQPPPTCPAGTNPKQVFAADFETNDGGFTHAGAQDEWARGTPTSAPITTCNGGTKCWKTDLAGTYNANSDQTLTSPGINLANTAGPIKLTWAQKYQMENASQDHYYVEVREVGGGNPARVFEYLGPTMADTVGAAATPINESAGWGLMTADLSAYAGKNVEVRFHVDSDGANQYSGAAVDDVRVLACCIGEPKGDLRMAANKNTLTWTGVPDATGFDIAYRRVAGTLFDGNFTMFTQAACAVPGTTFDISGKGTPPIGSFDLWILRTKGSCEGGTWNEGFVQIGNRDTGVPPTVCP